MATTNGSGETEVGSYCEVSSCQQRDFLPFTCDLCSKKVCLSHKSYVAHSCAGSAAKDMTSMDCPVCNRSIKFSRADAPDEVWARHYATACQQQPQNAVSPGKCIICSTILGISNTFHCTKCRLDVCLAHRLPEDHSCRGPKIQPPAAPPQNSYSVPAKKSNPPVITTKTTKRTNQPPSQYTGENSLKGSAERRMAAAAAASTGARDRGTSSSSESFTCQLCGERFADAVFLVSHFESAHPNGGATSSSSSGGSSSSSSGNNSGFAAAADMFTSSAIAAQNAAYSAFSSAPRTGQSAPPTPLSTTAVSATPTGQATLAREVCPICQRRFAEATELIAHYEASHNVPPTDNRSSTTSGTTPQVFSGQDCTLS